MKWDIWKGGEQTVRPPSRDCVSMLSLKEYVQECQAREMGSDIDRVGSVHGRNGPCVHRYLCIHREMQDVKIGTTSSYKRDKGWGGRPTEE